jgi:CubicO group peptidase (beta-lactamase class C family)
MTARGAARMYAALLGHVDGSNLISSQRRTAMAAVALTGTDDVMGFPASWAFGYSPDRPGGVPSRRGSTFGMVGANGSAAYADIDSGLAVAVMRNGPPAAGLAAVTRIDRLIAETEEHQ